MVCAPLAQWKALLCGTCSLTIAVALIIQAPPAPPITSMSPVLEMRMEGTIAEGGFSPRAETESIIPSMWLSRGLDGHTSLSTSPFLHSLWKTKLLLIPQEAQVSQKTSCFVLRPHLTRNWTFMHRLNRKHLLVRGILQAFRTCCSLFNPAEEPLAGILPSWYWCPLSWQTQGRLHQG